MIDGEGIDDFEINKVVQLQEMDKPTTNTMVVIEAS